MDEGAAAGAMARLDRLDRYLSQDPSNATLLADACDTALDCSAWERADGYLRMADGLVLDTAEWTGRRVRWLRAMHALQRLDEAWAWIGARRDAGLLAPGALGVASLIALDVDEVEAARQLADAALATDPRQLEALVAGGSAALARGDTAKARQLLGSAVEVQPRDGRSWSALGFATLHAGDARRAESQLQEAVRWLPDHVETWHALGWARLLRGDPRGARTALQQALALDHQFGENHAALALLFALTGEREQAARFLEDADRLDAGNATAAHARAVLAGGAIAPSVISRTRAVR